MSTANLSFGNGKSSTLQTGLYINGKFVPSVTGKTFAVVNPSNGKEIAQVAEASAKDIDVAVKAARTAYQTVWGEKTPGKVRGQICMKIAALIEANIAELAAIESLDNGKAFSIASGFDIPEAAATFRYYGGWADKNHGKVIEVDASKLAYTRHEPIGVCGQIIPWNFPFLMMAWKIAPAIATGNTVVLKTAEQTPLSALKFAELLKDSGLPDGVVNIVSGFGPVAGSAISAHMDIDKVAFTGSTLVGRNILKAAASSNLKKTTLELGGKSPNIIFDDANLEDAVSWACFGINFNHGQTCCAGSRVYVQASIYDKFEEMLLAKYKQVQVGDPFAQNTFSGPQVSQLQFDRIMGYIEDGKSEGGNVLTGGVRKGNEGYFIEPTIFTGVKPDAKIAREEIFGPVLVLQKFTDEEDLIRIANDSVYGLAAAVFSRDIQRAINTAHRLEAGTVWVNCYNQLNPSVPFGGYKTSGIGRELGEYALSNYTNVKAVHVNLSIPAPL